MGRHPPRRPDQRGHVHVVSAGVHDRDHQAGDRAGLAGLRRVRQAGLLFDGQSVHVGAHHHRGALAVLHQGDHSGSAHAFGDGEAPATQLRRQPRSRLVLHERQLGVAVEMVEYGRQVCRVVRRDGLAQRSAAPGTRLAVQGSREARQQERSQPKKEPLHRSLASMGQGRA